ncbi:hypothetical protein [Moraxella lacunata]|uniref:hypothetical protein n=1 Tax=Moraxella lacunata TaxID=477 RepID=UPI003EE2EDA4
MQFFYRQKRLNQSATYSFIYYIKTNNKKPLYPEWLLSLKSTKTAYAFGGKQLAKCLAGSVSYALMASSTVMPNALATPIP